MAEANELAEVHGGHLDVQPSIFAHIEGGLKKNPHGFATIVMHQSPDHLSELVPDFKPSSAESKTRGSSKCLRWTYSQLHGAALKLAVGLIASGVKPGMKVSTVFPNRVEWPLILWMSTILRVTIVPIDPGMLNEARKEERIKLLNLLTPDAIVVLDEKGARSVDEVNTDNLKVKLVLDGSPPEGWTTLLSIASNAPPVDVDQLLEEARSQDWSDRHAQILLTSGTSSNNPKVCPRHVGATSHTLTAQVYGRGFSNESRILQSSANFRAIAPNITLAAWQGGGATVITDPTIPMSKAYIAAIKEQDITFILFVPAILHALVADPEFADLDVSNVTDLQLGGEIMTKDIFLKATRAFPQAHVRNGLGMSEGGGLFTWPYVSTPTSQIPFLDDICPIGQVAPGARIQIRDAETGEVMKRNQAGEVCYSCKGVIKSYLTSGFEATFTTDCDGRKWFRSGDLGLISTDRILYVLGRVSDRIKRSGVPIMPAALESCIEAFIGSQTSVVAFPHETLGQEPVAVVKQMNGRTESEVKEEILRKFGEAYALGQVVPLEKLGMDAFPLNATGKVVKRDLVEALKRYRERA